VIGEAADQQVREQCARRPRLGGRPLRHRRLHDALAGPAGKPGADDLEPRGDVVENFGDVLADADLRSATARAGAAVSAGTGQVFDLAARQMGRQWRTPAAADRGGCGVLARCIVIGWLARHSAAGRCDPLGVFEQQAQLVSGMLFGTATELEAPQPGNFMFKLGDAQRLQLGQQFVERHDKDVRFAEIVSTRYQRCLQRSSPRDLIFSFETCVNFPVQTPRSPLFIIGAPRSGNTLTRRVLMASGQIYIPPETYVFGEIIARWPRWFGLSWREKVWMVCAYFDRHRHRDELEIESFSPFAEIAGALPRKQQSLRDLYDCLYAFMAREHGYTDQRWGDKTPYNTYYLPQIVKKYPDAQYLYLVRDGRDVVASQVKAGFGDLQEAAQRWVDANEACLAALKNKRLSALTIGYEELVTSPQAVFERIFGWARLGFELRFLDEVPARLGDVGRREHHAQVMQPITAGSIGRWRETMSDGDVAGLSPVFGATMTRLGYTA
jgi:protein-tyrosine sulfotransferase